MSPKSKAEESEAESVQTSEAQIAVHWREEELLPLREVHRAGQRQ